MDDKAKIVIDGKWYEIGELEHPVKGQLYLADEGSTTVTYATVQRSFDPRHPLTPCEAPLAFVLGENVIATVDEETQPRITGEFRPTDGVERHWLFGKEYTKCSEGDPCIILSPPPPEPRTAEELLVDIEIRILGFVGEDGGYDKLRQIQKDIEAHRANLEAPKSDSA